MKKVLHILILCPWEAGKGLERGSWNAATHPSYLYMYRGKETSVVKQTSCLPILLYWRSPNKDI
jgi:hypothetical protein